MSKIFQLISSIQLGGAEMAAFDLAENCNYNHTLLELYNTSTEYSLVKKEEHSDPKYKQIINNCRKTPEELAYPFHFDKGKINIALCGRFEGLALTSIETSFSGVPVIASFAPGLDETLPEKCPFKFHLNNDKELYDIFDKINSNQLDKEAIKKMAYDYVNERFSLDRMINSYNELYNKML